MSFPSFLSPPRLCHLKKWPTYAGYGFNLHAEKGKAGQYIGKVDPDSPAEHGGLKTKDFLVEVNSVNVEDLSHQKVVEIVKEMPQSVRMLVVDTETYKYCKDNGIFISSTMPEVVSFKTPDEQPSAGNASSDQHDGRHEVMEPDEATPPLTEPAPSAQSIVDEQPTNEFDDAGKDFIVEEQEIVDSEPEQQQQQQQQQQQHQTAQQPREPSPTPQSVQPSSGSGSGSGTNGSAAAPAASARDPLGNISLDEIRAKIGNNRRTQVKMNPSTFSEKYSMFQAL